MRINKRPWERKSLQCLYNVARSDNTVKGKTAPTVARWHYVVRGDIWYEKTSEHLLKPFPAKAKEERRGDSGNKWAVYLWTRTLHCCFILWKGENTV